MPFHEFIPAPPLASYVQSLCVNKRRFTALDDRIAILPDRFVELIFNLGVECGVRIGEATHPLPCAYIVGLLDAPLEIEARGEVCVLRVRFYPWGFIPLLGETLLVVPLHSGLWAAGPFAADLWPALEVAFAEGGAGAAAAVAEEALMDRALHATLGDEALIEAAMQLLAAPSEQRINDIAASVGLSPRSLRRRCQALLGRGPKALAQTARFEAARDALWDDPDQALATLAASVGYADQAHMSRDFRRFAQQTPQQLAAEMRRTRRRFTSETGRNLQDA